MRGRRCQAQLQLPSGQRCIVTAGSQRLLLLRVLHHKGAATAVHHAAAREVLVQHLSHGLVNGALYRTAQHSACIVGDPRICSGKQAATQQHQVTPVHQLDASQRRQTQDTGV